MSKPFEQLKPIRQPSMKAVNMRLPLSVVQWINDTAKKHKLRKESIYASLLLAGIEQWNRVKPLERRRA